MELSILQACHARREEIEAMLNRIEHGRSLLRQWEVSKPTNFYDADEHLQRVLALRIGMARLAEAEPLLRQAGADSGGPVHGACALLGWPQNFPRPGTRNGGGG